MNTKLLTAILLGSSVLCSAGAAFAEDATLTIESWRNDDLAIWQDKLIPAFEAKNPGIKVVFSPSAPTEYNAALNAKLDAGSAGDLAPWLADAEINLDRNLRLQYLAGMSSASHGSGAIYDRIRSFRRFPEEMFTGTPARKDALRSAVMDGAAP